MMNHSIFFLLLALALCGCSSTPEMATPEPVSDSVSQDGVPLVVVIDAPTADKGTSFGPHRWTYNGYTASHVLSTISAGPITVADDKDKVIDFEFRFPDMTTEEARPIAIQAISDAVGGKLESAEVSQTYYHMTCGALPVTEHIPGDEEGTKWSVHNEQAAAYEISLEELQELLEKYREELFTAAPDAACKVSIKLDILAPLANLSEKLRAQAGVQLEEKQRQVMGYTVN
ncbi:hypothetical protein QWY85_01840 [Neolewinella lacunae]|uniref:Uncharacterized protein n=1 Tax=Neolewinella lacunae TaxID=1517758 RepID=A0A923PNA6_9BACT|nr:hypothetical protein [Neolewinella lacunae]MBC6994444.1 hypothetical protein [Neolewinella lacunae]MDN3633380.1 hypothetical protein [Neolewinella lacunae]